MKFPTIYASRDNPIFFRMVPAEQMQEYDYLDVMIEQDAEFITNINRVATIANLIKWRLNRMAHVHNINGGLRIRIGIPYKKFRRLSKGQQMFQTHERYREFLRRYGIS